LELTLDASIALVIAAPFLAAIVAPLLQRLTGRLAGWLLALVPAGIFAFLLTLVEPVTTGGAIRAGFEWIPAYGIALSFLVDGLSLLFALTIAAIGTLVVLYAGAYLQGHRQQGRFFALLLAFMGAMLGLVLADSLLVLFIFWELTSIASFLLIGFDHTRQAARRAAIQSLAITNIGGMFLLAGANHFSFCHPDDPTTGRSFLDHRATAPGESLRGFLVEVISTFLDAYVREDSDVVDQLEQLASHPLVLHSGRR